MKRIIILGCSGSIGENTISVVKRFEDKITVVGLSAHTDEVKLLEMAGELNVPKLCLSGATSIHDGIRYHGHDGLRSMIHETQADLVVNGISGSDGLMPSIAALESGKNLALANKETLVMAGELIMQDARSRGLIILPVDSEHAALFQLLRRFPPEDVTELILTASGGAFRNLPLDELVHVSATDAMSHPVWKMGGKITIDSATMANKGLEVIEANRLFGYPEDAIKVSLHPQSLVHSMVKTLDGSVYAQISHPDMRVPIQNALSFPDTWEAAFAAFDYTGSQMDFKPWDPSRYPMLETAYETLRLGRAYPLVYNAANEVAVEEFIHGRIGFLDIHTAVASALERDWGILLHSYDHVLETDSMAREHTHSIISHMPGTR